MYTELHRLLEDDILYDIMTYLYDVGVCFANVGHEKFDYRAWSNAVYAGVIFRVFVQKGLKIYSYYRLTLEGERLLRIAKILRGIKE